MEQIVVVTISSEHEITRTHLKALEYKIMIAIQDCSEVDEWEAYCKVVSYKEQK